MERHAPNRRHWDEITPVHLASASYDVEAVVRGADRLEPIEVEAVGDVRGRTLLHLQCHIGTDTIGWARRGARVTAVDFSRPALDAAADLARRAGVGDRVRFVESDVLALDLNERFDVVYTSRGVLGWLSSLDRWAEVVARHLAPDGVFHLYEFHPVGFLFTVDPDGRLRVSYDYFHSDEPLLDDSADYADASYVPTAPAHVWIWSLADVFMALRHAGLEVTAFTEHEHSRFRQLPNMVEKEHGRWELPPGEKRLPFVFTMTARHARP